MLVLRDYREDDADRLVELANNEEVSRYMIDTFPYPYTAQDARWWIEEGCRGPGMVTKAIDVDGSLVGSVGLTRQAGWRSHLAEVGYWLGEPYWGRGLAAMALHMMCGHAFAELKIHKLYAPVLAPNTASMRVLQKCGFIQVGVLADEVCKHHRYYDVHQFERCNPVSERLDTNQLEET